MSGSRTGIAGRAEYSRQCEVSRKAVRARLDAEGAVSVAPFRERMLELGMTPGALARELGWSVVSPDTWRVKRTLGLVERNLHGRRVRQQYVTRGIAEQLADALQMDPYEWE